MSKLLAVYQNGNYTVKLYSDGTKIKSTHSDKFIAEFPIILTTPKKMV